MASNRRRGVRAPNADLAGEEAPFAGAGAVHHSPERPAGAGNQLNSPPPAYVEAAHPPQQPPLADPNNLLRDNIDNIRAMQNATVINMDRHHHESMQGLRGIRDAILEAMHRIAQGVAPHAPPVEPVLPPPFAQMQGARRVGPPGNQQQNPAPPKTHHLKTSDIKIPTYAGSMDMNWHPQTMNPFCFPMMFPPGMMAPWSGFGTKPKRKRSEAALKKIQARTAKFKAGEVTKREEKSSVSSNNQPDRLTSFSPKVPTKHDVRYVDASCQTEPVLCLDINTPDARQLVMREEESRHKKKAAEILRQRTYKCVQRREEKRVHDREKARQLKAAETHIDSPHKYSPKMRSVVNASALAKPVHPASPTAPLGEFKEMSINPSGPEDEFDKAPPTPNITTQSSKMIAGEDEILLSDCEMQYE
ncbi:unnamed protein product [Orchesella dallaii]|uniref:Uncharacterized protein n=1 Tax=Orchesella dallaii TaxID=48710 RepID=A0ABP1PXC9_9HEXA